MQKMALNFHHKFIEAFFALKDKIRGVTKCPTLWLAANKYGVHIESWIIDIKFY